MSDTTTWHVDGPIAGQPSVTFGRFDLARHGYVVEEYFLSGTATAYRDDNGTIATASSADYRARLVVCRPSDPARFDGTAVVEWFNVSGGGDGHPDWMFLHREIMRKGHAWVGVSAQRVGLEGARMGMRQLNPERYGSLVHPGDEFAFAIYSHAGLAVRNDERLLAGRPPGVMVAVGESQSAMYLVNYINRVDPLDQVYDAFLVHGRGGRGMGWRSDDRAESEPIRSPRVPTITVQSETDVVSFKGYRARCDDSALTRFWEIAGAAHFDTWGLYVSQEDDGTLPPERLAELGTTEAGIAPTAEPVNSGPQQHYVLQAALAHLVRWASGGDPPPPSAYLDTTADGDQVVLQVDEHGIARGGVRTPWVDVPTAVLSGLGATGEGFVALFGVTRRFDKAKLADLYPGGRDDYLARFAVAAAEASAAGYLLDSDIDEIVGVARASWRAD